MIRIGPVGGLIRPLMLDAATDICLARKKNTKKQREAKRSFETR